LDLTEFNYYFNRRFDLIKIVDQLFRDIVRTPPMPEQLLKLAENGWIFSD
jgi:hypothetical protein